MIEESLNLHKISHLFLLL